MYQNQIIHVIIGFKHDVSCIVRSEARRGHDDQSMHEARSAECIDVSEWPLSSGRGRRLAGFDAPFNMGSAECKIEWNDNFEATYRKN